VLLDSDGRVSRRYGLIGFPTNILIDQQGKILFLKPGLIDAKELSVMVEGSSQVGTQ